jgi:hypothetical protein
MGKRALKRSAGKGRRHSGSKSREKSGSGQDYRAIGKDTSPNFGLIGTITHDVISFDSGQSIEGLGGILYQAAVLCGLGKSVFLYTHLGEELAPEVGRITKRWTSLSREGISLVSGPGNRVDLHYPEEGERVEILRSCVLPLNPSRLIKDIRKLGMLILVINSGFDIRLSDWREIVRRASCPVWMDIHSLLLSRRLNAPREYVPLAEWREWVKGASYVQANRKEVASMLGLPDKAPSESEIFQFGKMAFELGSKAVFVTLGKEGVLVITPAESRKIAASEAGAVVDTTGCGDVFCGGTVVRLVSGEDPFASASSGLKLATKAVSVKGVQETYLLARSHGKKRR